ncbi:hypothetical protein EVG20_g6067 [Dentipellis fragilis]|uniref:Uncharacterized protein n=1 Tax=Dentipellis fragilis TaxID=205917 RepID=A0A4Y9YNB2_9AGAM|nr:hypothetical protein EVG20_g6067 [Dentipellis fragilis]
MAKHAPSLYGAAKWQNDIPFPGLRSARPLGQFWMTRPTCQLHCVHNATIPSIFTPTQRVFPPRREPASTRPRRHQFLAVRKLVGMENMPSACGTQSALAIQDVHGRRYATASPGALVAAAVGQHEGP